jgi:hypothetical protein
MQRFPQPPECLPAPVGLEDRVKCLWQLWEGPEGRLPVVPDGCQDLVVCRQDRSARAILAGVDHATTWAPVDRDLSYIGIRFQPGVDLEPLGFRAQDLVGERVELPLARATSLGRWLRSALAAEEPFPLLCEGLEARLRPPSEGTREALECAAGQDWPFISHRTLQRHVFKATGVPPSVWQQLRRVRLAACKLLSESSVSLATLALEAGYADQAHMTREFRRRFGLTPGRLRREADYYRSIFLTPGAF